MEKPSSIPTPESRAEEESLVQACRAGQPEGFDRLFRIYAPQIERVIVRLIGATADLEDILQNTFVEAMRSFARFRGEASVKTWVTRIAVHVTMNQLRRGVRRHVALELLPSTEEPVATSASPDEAVDDRQLGQRLHVLLDRISPKKRVAFLLYAVEGQTIEEVAALTGAGRAATKSRIWFARRELLAMARKDPLLLDLARAQTEAGPCR